jgi:hypothetical protein
MSLKQLGDVKPETVAKKFNDKDFERSGQERNHGLREHRIPKDEFFELALTRLKLTASQRGL